ncbi:hypothetical protein STRAU_5971 [Streptomyces aurantiacus JA 4570]|uniref:Uncharacterized protein n=1 Tax=Streptomyces aurantiacus JA 4570 TaxID=1286094 RepID=S3ZRE7_9ACTN|nr:hypothetical protein STRAU_5971 [Streptomyces aurantiacus JA 4570]
MVIHLARERDAMTFAQSLLQDRAVDRGVQIGEVLVVVAVCRGGHRVGAHAGHVGQQLVVVVGEFATRRQRGVEPLQVDRADGGVQFAHPPVAAGPVVQRGAVRALAVVAPAPHLLGVLGVRARHQAALAAHGDLRGEEGERAEPPESAREPAAERRAERVRGVLHDRDAAPLAQREDVVQRGRDDAADVHGQHGRRVRMPVQGGAQRVRVQAEAVQLDVDEPDPGARAHRGRRRREERVDRHEHGAPGHADDAQGDLQGGRAGRDGHALAARPGARELLEAGQFGALGEMAGGERGVDPVEHRAAFGHAEVDALGGHVTGGGAGTGQGAGEEVGRVPYVGAVAHGQFVHVEPVLGARGRVAAVHGGGRGAGVGRLQVGIGRAVLEVQRGRGERGVEVAQVGVLQDARQDGALVPGEQPFVQRRVAAEVAGRAHRQRARREQRGVQGDRRAQAVPEQADAGGVDERVRAEDVQRAQGVADECAEQRAAGERERVREQRARLAARAALLVQAADAVLEGQRDEARPGQVLGDVAVGEVRRGVAGELVQAGVPAAEHEDGGARGGAVRRSEQSGLEGAPHRGVEGQAFAPQAARDGRVDGGDREWLVLDAGQARHHRADLAGPGGVRGGVGEGRGEAQRGVGSEQAAHVGGLHAGANAPVGGGGWVRVGALAGAPQARPFSETRGPPPRGSSSNAGRAERSPGRGG